MTRESFVFHADYISDLPDEYKGVFLMYCYEYGIHGKVPNLQGLEKTVWTKIQRRIDTDFAYYEKTCNARKAACSAAGKKHKGNQYTARQNAPQVDNMEATETTETSAPTEITPTETRGFSPLPAQMEQNGTNWNELEQNGTNGTDTDIDIDSDSEFDTDFECDTDTECKNVSEFECECVKNTPSQTETVNIINYPSVIFNLVNELNAKALHKLPVNYSQFAFNAKEAREFLESVRGIHSNDQLQAIKNLFLVLNLADARFYPKSWAYFCKTVTEYLPQNFDIERYKTSAINGNFKRFAKNCGANDDDVKAAQLAAIEKAVAV